MTAKELTIIRTPKNEHRPFFSTARETAQDSALTFEARGVLWYLLSKPDDWKVQWQDIANQGGFGRDKAKSIMAELRAAGYVVTEMKHGEHGKFAGKVDRIYETSQRKTDSRNTELPSTGLASKRRNRRIHITEDIQNTETNAAIAAQADSAVKVVKPINGDKPRDVIFDGIASGSFGISGKVDKDDAPRVARISNWIKKTYPNANEKTLAAFYKWYDTSNDGAARPRDLSKFKEHFIAFHDEIVAKKAADQKSNAKQTESLELWQYDLAIIEGRAS
jgi:hypothetical protein